MAALQQNQYSHSMKDYITTIYYLTKEKENENQKKAISETPIIRVKDIASRLGVAPPSVVEYVQRLKDSGIVEVYPRKGVTLTTDGLKEAKVLSNRYRIVQCFFSNVLKVDNELAVEQAHTIEHLMSPEVIKKLYDHIDGEIGCPNADCNLADLCIPQ